MAPDCILLQSLLLSCTAAVHVFPALERIMLVIGKLISLNCNPGENDVLSCAQGDREEVCHDLQPWLFIFTVTVGPS